MVDALLEQVLELDNDSLMQLVTGALSQRPEIAYGVVAFAVPDLTFPPLKAITTHRSTGVIKSYVEKSQYGFIDCPDIHKNFQCDVFFPGNQLKEGLGVGASVSFAVFLNNDLKPQGFDLMATDSFGKGKVGKGDCFKGNAVANAAWPMQATNLFGATQMWGKGNTGGTYGELSGAPAPKRFKGQSPMGKGNSWAGSANIAHGYVAGPRPNIRAQGPPVQEEQLGEFGGRIKSWGAGATAYGFIECPALKALGFTNDVFLHQEQVGAMQVGDFCMFEAFLKNGRPQAKNLKPCDATPQSLGF